jgi:UDP-2,4-diacetamido-2,4,6-trideoxy-beta-L-altropyranose hydrolase
VTAVVSFVLSGNPQGGLGHLSRCLVLAGALASHLRVVFQLRGASPLFVERIAASGFEWREGAPPHDGVLIVDSYEFTDDEIVGWARAGAKVVLIDDLRQQVACDIVVSPGPQNSAEDYPLVTGPRLVGLDYALINPAFYEVATDFRRSVRRVLIGFGGTDPADATAFAARAVAAAGREPVVVLGAAYKEGHALPSCAQIHRDLAPASLAALMGTVDAGIVAGGVMSLEVSAAGLPSLVLAISDSQIAACTAFSRLGMILFAGMFPGLQADEFAADLRRFLDDARLREQLIERQRAVMRPGGADRVADAVRQLVQRVRPT